MIMNFVKNIMTINRAMIISDDEWNSFNLVKYTPVSDSWSVVPPIIISKAYDEEQANLKKARKEEICAINEALRKRWIETRQFVMEQKWSEEEKVKAEKAEKAKKEGTMEVEKVFNTRTQVHKKHEKKMRIIESSHNEARRAKKNEKKVLDKARTEFFQNSTLLFNDQWIISIGTALGMEKPQYHIREIKEKLNVSCIEKVKIVKNEDEISKEEVSGLSEEHLESLKAEEKKDDEEIQALRSNATIAIEVATVSYEADVKRRLKEAIELEIMRISEKETRDAIAEVARAQTECSLMAQADIESREIDEEYNLFSILKNKYVKKLSFEQRFPIWKRVVLPVIKIGTASVSDKPNIISANVKPKKNRLCRSLKIGAEPCTRENCSFLHSLKELKQNPCPYKKCRNVKIVNGKYHNIGVGCPFHHNNESPKDYFIRDGYLPVPAGYYDAPKFEESPKPKVVPNSTSVEVKLEVGSINCNAWKETNTKILCYPGQELQEIKISTRIVERITESVPEVKNTKTKMCVSVSSGDVCRHGEKCRYAHSIDELVVVQCQHGEKCLFVCIKNGLFYNSNGKFCKFIHPEESRENFFSRNGIVNIEKKPEPPRAVNNTCTKVCNSVIQRFECRHKTCNFAHTVDELNIRPCNYPNCKLICHDSRGQVRNVNSRNKCSFFHEGETKESFFARIISN